MKIIRRGFTFFALLLVIGCGNSTIKQKGSDKQNAIMVFAAASLSDVLTELVDSFKVDRGVDIKVNFASSGTLARQITQGVKPHIYISASKNWAYYIDSLGFSQDAYTSVIAENSLVFIVPQSSLLDTVIVDSTFEILPVLGEERLSMGDPAHVPAGKYGKQALEYYGLYADVETRLLPAKDVRSALMVVELAESPLGIVYKTDALKSELVKVVADFASKSHQPIEYVAGVCELSEASKEFFLYLNSEETKGIWLKHGFQK